MNVKTMLIIILIVLSLAGIVALLVWAPWVSDEAAVTQVMKSQMWKKSSYANETWSVSWWPLGRLVYPGYNNYAYHVAFWGDVIDTVDLS